jgi:alpha-glucosidase
MKDSVEGYKNMSIPLDTQWVDIDYMNNYQDFTYDNSTDRFGGLPSFVQELKNKSMHFIPIVDLGIAKVDSGYQAYTDGVANDVFLKIHDGKTDFVGQVWPGDSVYPDFFNSKTVTWW